jgi:hypothetical protein
MGRKKGRNGTLYSQEGTGSVGKLSGDDWCPQETDAKKLRNQKIFPRRNLPTVSGNCPDS